MEERFYISFEEWTKNKDYCKEVVSKNPKLLQKKATKGGFSGDYLNWLIVWKWMKKNYPDFVFEINEIEVHKEISGWIKGTLIIKNVSMGTFVLTMETFKKSNGEFYQETPEQLQMRIFVKLVANITGFGIHLWEK